MATVNESDVITGVWLVEPDAHGDERGRFVETYRRSWFPAWPRDGAGATAPTSGRAAWSGSTTTCTRPTTGTCPRAVPASCCTTSARPRRPKAPRSRLEIGDRAEIGVFIPPGVAHGFAALTDLTITYLVDQYYNADDELGVAWDDPDIGADWQLDRSRSCPSATRRNPRRADLPPGRTPYFGLRT